MDIEMQDGRAVLQPKGDLTIFEAAEFRQGLLTLSEKQEPIELCLSHVQRIDSAGVQLIVNAHREMNLQVTGMSPKLQERFETIGCGQFFETTERTTHT